ncbi:hypothetical protein DPQ25_09855 [Hydrogeniiclostridium mannosilyticum]|uniref:Uncharacterized protein n=1 Tax=Hydrogeniiclostridium mannosilyticum TaxID=2764322 RepID=A0A328UBT9_9FIRM|nr:hypothetical protein [Hydrogeniiclostridium mannosilyticum]RAQ28297.1 hypothetical protein DPQ25_09855 [Hydrogeniiclostridium mannosilyticum]
MISEKKNFFRRLNLRKGVCFFNGTVYLFITVSWLFEQRVGWPAIAFTAAVSALSLALGIVQAVIEKRDRKEASR